ncbi:MAG: NifU family protein [Euryarchaeota archaeon]|nr:NifU family protein [Euryarchaeota archaeon]
MRAIIVGSGAGCPMSQFTLTNFVEGTLKAKVPGVTEVVALDDVKERFIEMLKR